MPPAMASHPHRPTCSKAGTSPRAPNQSKPSMLRPAKSQAKPASAAKKPMTEMRMGGFFT